MFWLFFSWLSSEGLLFLHLSCFFSEILLWLHCLKLHLSVTSSILWFPVQIKEHLHYWQLLDSYSVRAQLLSMISKPWDYYAAQTMDRWEIYTFTNLMILLEIQLCYCPDHIEFVMTLSKYFPQYFLPYLS